MLLGIDGSNLRGGGTVTHLIELLRHAKPETVGIERVEVWSGKRTLGELPSQPWLTKRHDPMLDRSLAFRVRWQIHSLPALAREAAYNVLFAPGGTCTGKFRPVVTMSQNMLPFHAKEFLRYGVRWNLFRMFLLRLAQSRSFRTADGVIFLSEFARDSVLTVAGSLPGRVAIIPHGIPSAFRFPPRRQLGIEEYNTDRPFRLLYVSTVDEYKHQWNVAEAVGILRGDGLPVVLDIVGGAYEPARKRLMTALNRIDPGEAFITYRNYIPYEELPLWYERADMFVFASSCENQPIALLEAMAAGLPITSSALRPMSDMIGPHAQLFDPTQPGEIARAIQRLIADVALRTRSANDAYSRADEFVWEHTAAQTMEFLGQIARPARDQ